ncbi:MAG: penicillin-binding protein 2 [Solirubrobacterales bacterium]|nr:penicillin-binding protein 2 [Solirubrobacterales bacterium]MCB8971663.1 penicillin-binding protein 2 [Thermoleophilales bacterium]
MNAPIVRLFIGVLVLFALLVGFTSNWAVFDADELAAKSQNKRPLFEAQQIERGKILTADGEVIAESKPKGKGDQLRYVRRYPLGSLFGNPVGYSFLTEGQTGLEQTQQAVLTGEDNEFVSILDQIRGRQQEGSNVVTTLDSGAQQLAVDQLDGQSAPGAIVAIEPDTGAVKAMVATPGYDPNTIPTDKQQLLEGGQASGLFNRSIQGIYPPGSTFKVVTAAAALDSGAADPDTTLDGSSPQTFSGVPLENAGGEEFGDIDMRTALTHSVNTYFAQLGEEVGTGTLLDYMERFGFEKDPEVQLPDDQMATSGVFNSNGKLVDEGFDVARVAIGQGGAEGQILATPFQMAEVAAAIANGGKLMRPSLVQEVKDPDGRTTSRLDPDVQSDVVSEDTAAELTDMMTSVVDEGTAAALAGDLGGVTFAGKTGTAEKNLDERINQPWFIGFAPADDPQIAVAATIEQCTGCFGGEVAGPMATAMMNYFVNGG